MVRRAPMLVVATLLFTLVPSLGSAQNYCLAADPTDSSPDDVALNACLSGGGTIELQTGASPGYLIDDTLYLTEAGTVLRGSSGNPAYIKATDNLVGLMLIAENVSSFQLEHLNFNGDKYNRTLVCQGFDEGKNIRLMGDDWLVFDVVSEYAVCGSGAEVKGSDFEISYSQFNDNGFPVGGWGQFADGLTVWQCDGGYIHHNQLKNNTDVDLIVGGGVSCTVTDNLIVHDSYYGFAGLMIGYFPGADGDHSGGTYSNNEVWSDYNLLSF